MHYAIKMNFEKVKHILTSNTKPKDKNIPLPSSLPPRSSVLLFYPSMKRTGD